MQFSVSTYSFHKLKDKETLDLFQIAKDMGFDAIEVAGLNTPDGISDEEYAKKLFEESERLSLPICNYTIGADMINGSDGDLQKEIDRLKKEVDIAAILGVKGMRHDATRGYDADVRGYKGFDDALPRIIEGCRAVTEYAKTKGIKTMVENHGYFSQDSDRVEKIVNGVANDNFGLLVDMGNFLCVDENPVLAVSRLAPYAVHVHAKDFHVKSGNGFNPGKGFFTSRGSNYLRGSIIGHGDVPVKQCIDILKKAGYDGMISIEFEGMEDTITAIEIGLQNLKAMCEA